MYAEPTKLARRTSSDTLTDLIREAIVSGTFPAGARLTVEEIATRYGVSQMPVRQALQRLQGEGIVVLLPHKGARVVSLDRQLVANIYDLRGAVESLLARSSLPNLTNAAMDRLDGLHGDLREAVEAGEVNRAFAVNGQFHRLMYGHARNPVALEIYDRYAGLLGALRKRYGVGPGRLRDRVEGVSDTLSALHAKDSERLGALAALHCELSKRELLALMGDDGSEGG